MRDRDDGDDSDGGVGSDADRSPADELVELVLRKVALLHSPDLRPWAYVKELGLSLPIDSGRFRHWVDHIAFVGLGAAPSVATVNTALRALRAQALFGAPEHDVFTRVAERDGSIYLDLAGDDASAVEIDATGWRIISAPPVQFQRPPGARPLPRPTAGGSLEALAKVLNLSDPSQVTLLSAWLAAALRPSGPFPVLVLRGPPGSAKSTAAEFIRALVDPAEPATRSLPRDERDLFIHAASAHVLNFDNVSSITPTISDSLCRLATGGGYAVRRLRTDADEAIFSAQRPILLNGVDGFVVRGDLIDRAIELELEPVSDARRRPARELRAEFEHLRPLLLGALLDAVALGLKRIEHVTETMASSPRMADFFLWGLACEPALGGDGVFVEAFNAARRDALPGNLENDAVALVALEFLETRGEPEWTGSATDLLDVINPTRVRTAGLPTFPNALSHALFLAAPLLQRAGWTLTRTRSTTSDRARQIVLRKIAR